MPAATAHQQLLAAAESALREGRYREARRKARQALAGQPDCTEALHLLGLAEFFLGDLDSARKRFGQVAQRDTRHWAAMANLGALLNRLGRYDEAVETLRRSLQVEPRGVEAYFNLGFAYRRLGETVPALDAFQECVRLNPDIADAHRMLGDLYLQLRRQHAAEEHYRRALHLRPQLESARLGLVRSAALAAKQQYTAKAGELPPSRGAAAAPKNRLQPALTEAQRREVFSALYNLAVHGEKLGQEWNRILSIELPRALKSLADSFVAPGAMSDQARLHERFRRALHRFESFQQQLRANGEKVRDQAHRVPR